MFAFPSPRLLYLGRGLRMGLQVVDWVASWPMVLPYYDGKVLCGLSEPGAGYPRNDARRDGVPDREQSRAVHDADGWRLHEGRRHSGRRSAGGGSDCVWVEPVNLRYQPVSVSVREDLHVFGVVKHAIHTLHTPRRAHIRQPRTDGTSLCEGACGDARTRHCRWRRSSTGPLR